MFNSQKKIEREKYVGVIVSADQKASNQYTPVVKITNKSVGKDCFQTFNSGKIET